MNKLSSRVLSLVLAVVMMVSTLVVMTVPATAEETETPAYTKPTVEVVGPVDTWDKTTQTQPTQTDAEGYVLITSAAEFAWWLKNPVSGDTANYRLTTNLDMANAAFARNDSRVFGGIFDGAGYVISNFQFRMSGYSGNGYLFKTVTGTFKNLTFNGVNMSEALNSRMALINVLDGGTVSNVTIVGLVGQKASVLAGIAVEVGNNAVIEDCVVSGTLTTAGNAGYAAGIACNVTGGATVRNCTSYVDITSPTGSAGGIVVQLGTTSSTATVEGCVNYGTVTTTKSGEYAGGIVAKASSRAATAVHINNCANYGAVSNTHASKGLAHGIVGIPSDNAAGVIYLDGCVNYADISAYTQAGGIVSYANHAVDMTNCANYGNITSTGGEAGGLAAKVDGRNYASRPSALYATNCANYGDVTGATYAGGFVGWLRGSSAGELSGKYKGLYVYGGLSVGTVTGATDAAACAGFIKKDSKLEVVLENAFFNGAIAGATSEAATTLTVGSNVYADLTAGDALGANNAANEAIASIAQYSADAMADGTYLAHLNAYVASDAEDAADVVWYQSGKQDAPALASTLKVSQATVSIKDSIAVIIRLTGVNNLPAGTTLAVNVGNQTVDLNKVGEGTYQATVSGIKNSEIALRNNYSIVVNGEAGANANYISVVELLAGIYGNSSAEEQAVIGAMLDYAYYAGKTSVFDTFNAIAGTALAASDVSGVEAIAGAAGEAVSGAALDLNDGFVIVGTTGTVRVSVLLATGSVTVDGTATSAAAMLNAYLGQAETHDLAAAAINYYNAVVAAKAAQ